MPITLASHHTLRNVPWDVLIHKCFKPWKDFIRNQDQWTLEEMAARFMRTDGFGDQAQYEFFNLPSTDKIDETISPENETAPEFRLGTLGFFINFGYKDGSNINVRLMAVRQFGDTISVDAYTTLDLAQGRRPQNFYFSLHRQLNEFTIDSGNNTAPRLYFGEVPPSIILNPFQQVFWNFLAYQDPGQSVFPHLREKFIQKIQDIQNNIQKANNKENNETSKEDNPAYLKKRIKQLEEKLEESSGENDALSEQLEESKQNNRELAKANKYQSSYIQDLKDKNDRLKQRVEQADKLAHASANEQLTAFCDAFDKENEELTAKLSKTENQRDDFQKQLQDAEGKIKSLKGRLGKVSNGHIGGLLNAPSENEKFNDEFGIAIFSALHKAIEKTPTKSNSFGSRPIDVWQAIIDANPDIEREFQEYQDVKDQLMDAMKSNNMERNFHLLAPLGMTHTTHANNHWKITFADGDERYNASHASTPSDTWNGPSNSAKDLKNAFLYPG